MMRLSLFASCAAGALGVKSYVMKVSQVIGGNPSEFLEIDHEAKTQRVLNNELTAETDFVKGSVICGDVWYGIGSSMTSGNVIARIDLTTGHLNVTNVGGLWYHLKCGAEPESLYGVVAINSPPQFGLVKMSFLEPGTQIIAQFPDVLWAGWPSTFTFSGNELQANFAVKGRLEQLASGGEVYRMDITTGEITMHKSYKASGFMPGGGVVPYYIKHTEGSMTAKGIFAKQELQGDLKVCDVDFSGAHASVSNCKKLPSEWWGVGAVPAQCADDGLDYYPSQGGMTESYEPLMAYNLATAESREEYQIPGAFYGDETDYYIGAHTCVNPQVSV